VKKIKCSELGVRDCDFVAKGESAGEIVKEVVEHLRAEHDIDMPDTDAILAGEVGEDPVEVVDKNVALIVKRLTTALNIVPPEEPEQPEPSIGTMPSA
jgi:predicted small metal-binding protein